MTRAEIEKLSGRELDAAVCKMFEPLPAHEQWDSTGRSAGGFWFLECNGGWQTAHVSTDPAACKLVRDEMSKRGYGYSIIRLADSANVDALFWPRNEHSFEFTAETEEIACCRAALLALAEGGIGNET